MIIASPQEFGEHGTMDAIGLIGYHDLVYGTDRDAGGSTERQHFAATAARGEIAE